MIDDIEKMRRIRALDLARRQEMADRAKRCMEGVPAQKAPSGSEFEPSNPNTSQTVIANDRQ